MSPLTYTKPILKINIKKTNLYSKKTSRINNRSDLYDDGRPTTPTTPTI